jgi:hypothetical protein
MDGPKSFAVKESGLTGPLNEMITRLCDLGSIDGALQS